MAQKIPDAAIFVVVEPKARKDYDKMEAALRTIASTDPTIRLRIVSTGFKVTVYGMCDGQLDILLTRLRDEFRIGVVPGSYQVAYRETIRSKVVEEGAPSAHGRRQLFCTIQLEPLPRGSGFQFTNEDKTGQIPEKFSREIEKGVTQVLSNASLPGRYPMTDVKASLLGGTPPLNDTPEEDFWSAGIMAAIACRNKSKPIFLEPIMSYEVRVPEQYMGDVIGDLNSRRARILNMGDRKGLRELAAFKFILCHVPLAEIVGHSRTLSKISAGLAKAVIGDCPDHWEEISPDKIKAITDPHGTDEPPTASAGRPVLPIRPKPGIPGRGKRIPPADS
ncbi:MAG: TetM/TetW/TetO/TetS family tetracycline resistance ribosomal protection protein [Elusimicrobia bacterium]|nr:TetM/TetW/TetO/TetS family tetracycline resistance ribosomal protection protein [Elusimicrobiota bacterium]